jgi:hypothetical protein
MFLHTSTVTVLPGFRLRLSFNNGVAGEIYLLDQLWGEMFEPLKDEALFATAHHNDELGTVVWGNGADFAPEFLLELMQRQQRHAA